MRLRIVLRLISALIFATFAAIFTLLIPPIPNVESNLVRILLTIIAALVGFLLFPDIANNTTRITLKTFNLVLHRVASEVSSQMLRLRSPSPFPQTTPQTGGVTLVKPLILDTSAIIDGRILDIAKVSFINGLILVPRFVLTELQQVADSSDDLKRGRGRRGFETVEQLKRVKGVKLEIWDKDQNGKTVDEKLINLAKSLNGKIITTDFNLNRVSSLAGVGILNVNDLSNAVKVVALPGEALKIKIVHIGKDSAQGIGYLEDGTMVVVSNGAEKIGKTIEVEVTKNIQNPAGRMIFAKAV